MFVHVTNTLNQLYRTDLELCRYKLSSVINKTTKHLDEHGICHIMLSSLIENFNNSILLPLFYYLFTGLSGLILYKTSDLTDLMLNYIKIPK